MKILPFDTETTGIPVWNIPSDDPSQPHLVQVAAILTELEASDESVMNVIVRPDGWVIPDDVIEIHGISQERAMDEGIPEKDAVEQLIEMWRGSKRVAYNEPFDARMIRIAIKRYFDDEALLEEWKAGERDCACRMARKVIGGKKPPKLAEAYEHFTGKNLDGAHDALIDARACLDVYRAILSLEKEAV